LVGNLINVSTDQRLNKMIIYNRLRQLLLRKRPFWCLYIQRKLKTDRLV